MSKGFHRPKVGASALVLNAFGVCFSALCLTKKLKRKGKEKKRRCSDRFQVSEGGINVRLRCDDWHYAHIKLMAGLLGTKKIPTISVRLQENQSDLEVILCRMPN